MKNLLLVTLLLSCVSLVYCQKKGNNPARSSYDAQPITEASNIHDEQIGAQNDKLAAQKIAFYECVHPDNRAFLQRNTFCLKKYSQSITLKDCEATAGKGHHSLHGCLNEFKDRISKAECKSLNSRSSRDAWLKELLGVCYKYNSSDAQKNKQNIDHSLDNISP